MRRHAGGTAIAAAVVPLLSAGLLLSGCASEGVTEWQVAANPGATAEEIIHAGRAVDIAIAGDQMVVAWEVEPEDDEGPHQGAWRLYDRKSGAVADGTFGPVRDASAHIDVVPLGEAFLVTDYVKHARQILDVEGRLVPAQFEAAELGTPLAGGTLLEQRDDTGWSVLLPDRRVVQLADLPTRDVQGIELTSDGTVWVLLPWTDDGTYRVAWAKDGQGPWVTETIPLPKGSGASGDGFSSADKRLFVVAGREQGDRTSVDAVLARKAGATGTWQRIDATGIADDLSSYPRIAVLRKGQLAALADGAGAWIQADEGSGFVGLRPPRAGNTSPPVVMAEGAWVWASQQDAGNGLYYTYNFGETWRRFDR